MGGVIEKSRQQKPLGEAGLSEERSSPSRLKRRQAVANPRKVARWSGIPKRVREIRSA